MDARQVTNIHGCKEDRKLTYMDVKDTNIHGCKGGQAFHFLKMNNFYEPVQQNDFKGQLTKPGKLTYMDVKELTYRDRKEARCSTPSKQSFENQIPGACAGK